MSNREKKISGITLHVGQHITGQVRTSVDAKRHNADMILTEIGVIIEGKGTKKLIPFSNIQGIDFDLDTDFGA